MEVVQTNRTMMFDKRPVLKNRAPAFRWVREWVTHDLVATGGKLRVQKWVREDKLKDLKEKSNTPEPEDAEPEPTTEVLFLCSYEGCGKTFIDAGALKKHSHIHGERQFACHFAGCGKKFLDSSKLKRHFLIHTGERAYLCPHEGCGKAFSLDFNLRAHMKTHSQENYHICPYGECGKRFAHDYKLQAHIKAQHEKNASTNTMKHTLPEKLHSAPKTPAAVCGSASSDRPYICPYEGCDKAYIHEYKLNLHLKKEHPRHHSEENGKRTAMVDHDIDEASEHDAYIGKNIYRCPYEGCGKSYVHEYKLNLHFRKEHPGHNSDENGKQTPIVDRDIDETGEHEAYIGRNGFTCPYEGCGKFYAHEYKLNLHLRKEHPGHNLDDVGKRVPKVEHEKFEANEPNSYVGKSSVGKNLKRSKPSFLTKLPPSKVARKSPALAPTDSNIVKKQWPTKEIYEEDSEETEEEDHENVEDDGWRYHETNEDDEETEDED